MVKMIAKKIIITAYIIAFLNVQVRAFAANSKPVESPESKTSVIAGQIGDYVIKKNELEKRLISELYPDQYEPFDEDAVPVDVNSVLMLMLSEKAMIMEARNLNYQEKENIRKLINDEKNKRTIRLLTESYLKKNPDKTTVTESEIELAKKLS